MSAGRPLSLDAAAAANWARLDAVACPMQGALECRSWLGGMGQRDGVEQCPVGLRRGRLHPERADSLGQRHVLTETANTRR